MLLKESSERNSVVPACRLTHACFVRVCASSSMSDGEIVASIQSVGIAEICLGIEEVLYEVQ